MNSLKHLWAVLFVLFMIRPGHIAAQSNPEAPVFVLVHGAWHGGWCWQEVSSKLTAKGYRVYTPTLSGLGEHKNVVNESINLDTHISDIINLIEMEDLHNVVLIGHSYAGAVIAGVADSIPARLNKLVFLDAMLVHNGESLHSLQPKKIQEIENKKIKDKQNFAPFPVELFGVTDSTKAAWVRARLTPQPFNTFAQKLALKHPYGNNLPLVYIACTNPQLPVMVKMSLEAQNSPSWKHIALNTGHDAMITMPDELSALFLQLAN